MLKKAFFLPVALLAAISPIAFFSGSEWWSKVTASLSSSTSDEAPGELGELDPGVLPEGADAAGIAGAPVQDFGEVLRFDVTPDWVVRRWPRVSAGLAHLELQGYRVPLVTGTAEDDLAGALTYYFNPRQQVQRITFYGTTGDTSKLVALVTSRFGFARRLTNDASMFLFEIPGLGGRPGSSLWIRPARVLKASDSRRRFEVALVVERPEKS